MKASPGAMDSRNVSVASRLAVMRCNSLLKLLVLRLRKDDLLGGEVGQYRDDGGTNLALYAFEGADKRVRLSLKAPRPAPRLRT